MAMNTSAATTARTMWALFEPIHAVAYFAPEAEAAYEGGGGLSRIAGAGRSGPVRRLFLDWPDYQVPPCPDPQ
ncbi:helix-turn-helix domain-containing protein [Streptomyces violaceusniger]|uniref:helix-turn-helix domain-containing protein n=1 Tax=Streptomyces violaceusniger TaxID=68280 RepID=UPI003F4A452E